MSTSATELKPASHRVRSAMRLRWPAWAALGVGALFVTVGAAAATKAVHSRSSSVEGPTGKLWVDDGGRGGMPVLFVHSFAGSTAHWQAQLAHLRPTRRALAMDLRGHGRSEPPRNARYAIADMADDIAAAADALDLQRFVLVGHSVGSAVAAAYAARHPERVAGLLLVGAPGKTEPAQGKSIIDALHADFDKTLGDYTAGLLRGSRPAVRKRIERSVQSVPHDETLALIEAGFANDPLTDLRQYRGPTLLIDSTADERPASLAAQAPHIEHRRIANAGHWLQLDQPAAFNAELDAFLRRLPQGDVGKLPSPAQHLAKPS